MMQTVLSGWLLWLLCGCTQGPKHSPEHKSAGSAVDPLETLVVVKNTDLSAGDDSIGVVIDKRKGWVLTVLDPDQALLGGRGIDVEGPQGPVKAKIIAEDPLYGVSLIQVDDVRVLAGRKEATLGTEERCCSGAFFAFERAASKKGGSWRKQAVRCVEQIGADSRCCSGAAKGQQEASAKDAFLCAQDARVVATIYPTQSIMLREQKGVKTLLLGSALFSACGALEGLWQCATYEGKGWVPRSVLHNVLQKAKSQKEDCCSARSLCGVQIALLETKVASVLLGAHAVPHADILYVRSVKKCGKKQDLQVGDVIERINGITVSDNFALFMEAMRQEKGESVMLDVIRYGTRLQVQAPLMSIKYQVPEVRKVNYNTVVFPATRSLSLLCGVPEGTYLSALGGVKLVGFVNGHDASALPLLLKKRAENLNVIGRYSRHYSFDILC